VADVALDQLVDSPVPFNDKTSQCQKRRQARQLFRFDRPGRNLWDEQSGACGMRGGRHGLAAVSEITRQPELLRSGDR
jgi:hypothetical protein